VARAFDASDASRFRARCSLSQRATNRVDQFVRIPHFFGHDDERHALGQRGAFEHRRIARVRDDDVGLKRADDRHGFLDRVDGRDRKIQLRENRLAHVAARGVLVGHEHERREAGFISVAASAARALASVGSSALLFAVGHGRILQQPIASRYVSLVGESSATTARTRSGVRRHALSCPFVLTHDDLMSAALDEARRARDAGEVPIGAIVAAGEEIVGRGFNQPISSGDPTAHAEIVAIRAAASHVRNYRLTGATLCVTIEPCLMCVGALVHARIATLVYGAAEPKSGAVSSTVCGAELPGHNHRVEIVSGVREPECRALMQEFFKTKRT
jgi:tRNA(adenine34) deaminase